MHTIFLMAGGLYFVFETPLSNAGPLVCPANTTIEAIYKHAIFWGDMSSIRINNMQPITFPCCFCLFGQIFSLERVKYTPRGYTQCM